MKRLIINADDFGMSKEVNEGIKRAIEAGVLNNISVMVNMPYFDDAISYLRKHPEVSVGLHFNITEGFPKSKLNDVPSLIREDGNFFYWTNLLFGLLTGSVFLKDIKKELQTQYGKLKKTGLQISHLDSHHHIHLYPSVFRIFLDFALKHKIRTLRGRTFKLTRNIFSLRRLSLKQLTITAMCFINNILFNHKKQFFEIDHLYDINWQSDMVKEDFLNLLDNLSDGTTQVICHPAVLSKTGNIKFLRPRQKELTLLLDRLVQKKISKYYLKNSYLQPNVYRQTDLNLGAN